MPKEVPICKYLHWSQVFILYLHGRFGEGGLPSSFAGSSRDQCASGLYFPQVKYLTSPPPHCPISQTVKWHCIGGIYCQGVGMLIIISGVFTLHCDAYLESSVAD